MSIIDKLFRKKSTVSSPKSFEDAVRIVNLPFPRGSTYEEQKRFNESVDAAIDYIGASGNSQAEEVLIGWLSSEFLVSKAAVALVSAAGPKAYDPLIKLFQSHPNSLSSS